jgi:hypothetical protein
MNTDPMKPSALASAVTAANVENSKVIKLVTYVRFKASETDTTPWLIVPSIAMRYDVLRLKIVDWVDVSPDQGIMHIRISIGEETEAAARAMLDKTLPAISVTPIYVQGLNSPVALADSDFNVALHFDTRVDLVRVLESLYLMRATAIANGQDVAEVLEEEQVFIDSCAAVRAAVAARRDSHAALIAAYRSRELRLVNGD